MADRMRAYAINIDDERREQLSRASEALGIPRSVIIRRLIDSWVAGHKVDSLPKYPAKGA